MKTYDFLIVGAGIVGLSVARELKRRRPDATVAILDKEEYLGVHASGRNSGVLHSGIYYGRDTMKAKVCAEGARRMMAFADEHGIKYRQSGKVIIATSESQIPTVERLLRNAEYNGVRAEQIDNKQLHELEPNAAESVTAIHCPEVAVIDNQAVLLKLREQLAAQGVSFYFGNMAESVEVENHTLKTNQHTFSYGYLFNCAGAYADTFAKMFGLAHDYELIPFKGIYWKLSESANHLVRSNIYPVPNDALPFLGVHLTRMVSDEVYIGPTAIPALGRENYGLFKGAKPHEAINIGLKLAVMYFINHNNFRHMAHAELAKYKKSVFLDAVKKLCPAVRDEDMVKTAKVGIRPQLINVHTHKIEMDYIFENTERSLHVLNTISPAFTSAFAFAEVTVDKAGVS